MAISFKDQWLSDMHYKLKLVYPDASDNEIMTFLNEKYDESFKDTKCKIYNNYEKEEIHTTIN